MQHCVTNYIVCSFLFFEISIYTTGTMKPLSIVDVSRPPSSTFAIGLWISLPGRSPPRARGISARAEVNAVINIGFNLSSDPRITASCSERPLCRSSLYLSISNIPFLVAIPNREMKPIIAGMLMMPSAKNIANTPPMRASGRLSRTADA